MRSIFFNKLILFWVLSLCLYIHTLSAQNMVRNGDFEQYTSLPTDVFQWYKCKGWYNPFYVRDSAAQWGPIYIVKGGFGHSSKLPYYNQSGVQPHEGNGFMELINSFYKNSYIATKVTLRKGKTYRVSFWLRNTLLDNGNKNTYTYHFGVFFASDSIIQHSHKMIHAKPQFEIVDNVERPWRQYTFDIEVDHDLHYLCLGDFHDYDLAVYNQGLHFHYLDQIEISEAKPVDTYQKVSICKGDRVRLNATSKKKYFWHNLTVGQTINSYGNVLDVSPDSSTKYMVTDEKQKDVIDVIVNELPQHTLLPDTSICHGATASYRLHNPDLRYEWSNGSEGSMFSTQKAGTYILKVSREQCSLMDTFKVHRKQGCEFGFLLPNVITPNNDGKNDILTPLETKNIIFKEFTAYNSWGVEVFHTRNPRIEWDASGVESGVYFWVIHYMDYDDKPFELKGIIEVKK